MNSSPLHPDFEPDWPSLLLGVDIVFFLGSSAPTHTAGPQNESDNQEVTQRYQMAYKVSAEQLIELSEHVFKVAPEMMAKFPFESSQLADLGNMIPKAAGPHSVLAQQQALTAIIWLLNPLFTLHDQVLDRDTKKQNVTHVLQRPRSSHFDSTEQEFETDTAGPMSFRTAFQFIISLEYADDPMAFIDQAKKQLDFILSTGSSFKRNSFTEDPLHTIQPNAQFFLKMDELDSSFSKVTNLWERIELQEVCPDLSIKGQTPRL